jgi:hypothetical protein
MAGRPYCAENPPEFTVPAPVDGFDHSPGSVEGSFKAPFREVGIRIEISLTKCLYLLDIAI